LGGFGPWGGFGDFAALDALGAGLYFFHRAVGQLVSYGLEVGLPEFFFFFFCVRNIIAVLGMFAAQIADSGHALLPLFAFGECSAGECSTSEAPLNPQKSLRGIFKYNTGPSAWQAANHFQERFTRIASAASIFGQGPETAVIGSLRLLGKKTRRELALPGMVGHALATFSTFAAVICAWALH
jgi:hypothetical protein